MFVLLMMSGKSLVELCLPLRGERERLGLPEGWGKVFGGWLRLSSPDSGLSPVCTELLLSLSSWTEVLLSLNRV